MNTRPGEKADRVNAWSWIGKHDDLFEGDFFLFTKEELCDLFDVGIDGANEGHLPEEAFEVG